MELEEETNKLAKVKSINVRPSWVVSETRTYEEHLFDFNRNAVLPSTCVH